MLWLWWRIWVLMDKWNLVMHHCSALFWQTISVLKICYYLRSFECKWLGLIVWIKMTYLCIDCYVTLVTHEWMDFVDRFIWCYIIDFYNAWMKHISNLSYLQFIGRCFDNFSVWQGNKCVMIQGGVKTAWILVWV